MSRRQGRISNRGNAKVGAGSRQRGYRKAGRVKRAGSKRSEYIGSPGKQGNRIQGKRSECQPGQNKTSQWVSVCVLLICECVNEVQVG